MAKSEHTAAKRQKKKPLPRQDLHKISKKPFKPKKKQSTHDHLSEPLVSSIQEDEQPDFPRGKISSREREIKSTHHESIPQYNPNQAKNKFSHTKTYQRSADFPDSIFADSVTGRFPNVANKLTIANISPGTKLWGLITQVNDKDLVVSLPCGLRGFVRAHDASDLFDLDGVSGRHCRLPQFFHAQQLVSCVVLQVEGEGGKGKGKRKIWLSLRLSLIYKGFSLDSFQEGGVLLSYVKSIEDHGYLLHFGLPNFTGFCPKGALEGDEIKCGSLLEGCITSIDRTRNVIHMNADPEIVCKSSTNDLRGGLSLHQLLPGMMTSGYVKSTLKNGILLSFLTYFTGTVDFFQLEQVFPSRGWQKGYHENKKVNARVLFVDLSTRVVGLTMNPHLIHNRAPPCSAKIGEVYENSKVVRVDRGLGILVEIPTTVGPPTPAYIKISESSNEKDFKLEEKFVEGAHLSVRVVGSKPLEGLAIGSLKAADLDNMLFDMKPGMVAEARVLALDCFGAIVQFASGVKAFCPLHHMSEFEIFKPRKKFKVGAELVFRVLGCKSKRITVTHKKTLLKSKLPIVSSYDDTSEGTVTHGWVTKILKNGCVIRFYNRVQGFAPVYELGLEPGCDIDSTYQVGQVVKCRVTSCDVSRRRMSLSLTIKPPPVSTYDAVKIGDVVSAVVEWVIPNALVVRVKGRENVKGTLSQEHLSDCSVLCSLMMSALNPGYEFEKLLLLNTEKTGLVFTAKTSLVNSARDLPVEATQVRQGSVVPGYVCNVIDTGCFVRFLGRLTAFCPRIKAKDGKITDLSEIYSVGQTVRAYVVDADVESGRITISLMQRYCASTDDSFIREFFSLEAEIDRLISGSKNTAATGLADSVNFGDCMNGIVHEVKDAGAVIKFEVEDVLGFITKYQMDGNIPEVGSGIQAAVIDIVRTDRLLDLSLKADFVNKFGKKHGEKSAKKKKRRREMQVGDTVSATVEIVRETYLVMSLPDHDHTLGYAPIVDYNTQNIPRKKFLEAQTVTAAISSLPCPSTERRLLLSLTFGAELYNTSQGKRAKRKGIYKIGALVEGEIIEVTAVHLWLKLGFEFFGRIHFTEVDEDNTTDNPLGGFRVGQTVSAVIVGKNIESQNKSKKTLQWELSMKPSIVKCVESGGDYSSVNEDFKFSIMQAVSGYVYEVKGDWVGIAISRNVKAQLFILDSSIEPSELREFRSRFPPGKSVSGYVLQIDEKRKTLRILLRPFSLSSIGKSLNANSEESGGSGSGPKELITHIHTGDVVGGRVSKVLEGIGGVLVQILPRLYGKVHFTDLADLWVPEPSSGYHEGQFLKCRVLDISRGDNGTIQIGLSLFSFAVGGGIETSTTSEMCKGKCVEKIEDLRPDMVVHGYVKSLTSVGCFVTLSRSIDARVRLCNLSDNYIEDRQKEFPVAKLIVGKVLSVNSSTGRVEVTLRKNNTRKSESSDFSNIHVGALVSGNIRRVEKYGLFVNIDGTSLVGLCHISKMPDEYVDDLESRFHAGEVVSATVLKVDQEGGRVSLGMKDGPDSPDWVAGGHLCENDDGFEPDLTISRASVCPLEVNVDGVEGDV